MRVVRLGAVVLLIAAMFSGFWTTSAEAETCPPPLKKIFCTQSLNQALCAEGFCDGSPSCDCSAWCALPENGCDFGECRLRLDGTVCKCFLCVPD